MIPKAEYKSVNKESTIRVYRLLQETKEAISTSCIAKRLNKDTRSVRHLLSILKEMNVVDEVKTNSWPLYKIKPYLQEKPTQKSSVPETSSVVPASNSVEGVTQC